MILDVGKEWTWSKCEESNLGTTLEKSEFSRITKKAIWRIMLKKSEFS